MASRSGIARELARALNTVQWPLPTGYRGQNKSRSKSSFVMPIMIVGSGLLRAGCWLTMRRGAKAISTRRLAFLVARATGADAIHPG